MRKLKALKAGDLPGKIKALAMDRRFQMIAAGFLAVFLVLNLAVFAVYKDKTLPHTSVNGKPFGSISFSQFDARLTKSGVLPPEVKLSYKDKKTAAKTSDLGFSLDTKKIEAYSRDHRSWLPLAAAMSSHKIPMFITVNDKQFSQAFTKLDQMFKQDPVNAHIVPDKNSFKLVTETNGYKLQEAKTKNELANMLARGDTTLTVPAETVAPQVRKQKLEDNLKDLQKQLKTSVIFRYQSKSYKLNAQDMALLYVQSGDTYALSDAQIRAKVISVGAGFGIKVQNINEAVAATKQSVSKGENEDFSLVAVTISRSYTYCVQLKGVDGGQQAGFESKIKSTLEDKRGWSLGGQVSFTQASSGCSMRIWLVAADQMPSFGAICDTMWSCTVSPNVIINYDRWSGASPSWNAAGGSLDEYRSMVINHEVGHWLGFGHKTCPGSGQPAPVMQQQSIDLQGCTFNAWPLPSELDALRSWYGI